MRKIPWWATLLAFVLGIGVTIVAVFYYKWIPVNSQFDLQTFGVWVGSIGSICAFIGVIITTKRQIEQQNINLEKQINAQNTNLQKQIESQNSIVEEQIKAQRKDVQEQIENQNKEGHKPCIVVNNCIEKENNVLYLKNIEYKQRYEIFESFFWYSDSLLKRELKSDRYNTYIKASFRIRNIGYGVGRYLRLIPITKNCIMPKYLRQDPTSNIGIEYIKPDEDLTVLVKILTTDYLQESNRNNKKILLVYCDLNNIPYSILLDVNIMGTRIERVNYYPNETKRFEQIMKKENKDYEKSLKRYFSDIF